MIIVGILLILAGYLARFPHHHVVAVIGWILLIAGLILLVAGRLDHPVGGRRYWW